MSKSIYRALSVIQGASFTQDFQVVDAASAPIPLTGFLGRCAIRDGSGNLIASPDVYIYDDDDALCTMRISSTATAAIDPGIYSYDVEIYAGTEQVHKPLYGPFAVIGEETT